MICADPDAGKPREFPGEGDFSVFARGNALYTGSAVSSPRFKATTFQHALIDLARRVDIVRGYRYRDAEYAVLAQELLPASCEVCAELLEQLEPVAAHYGQTEDDPHVHALLDVFRVARAELLERLRRIEEICESDDELMLISAAMAALGTVRRVTIVVENALAVCEGLTAALSCMDDAERALALRRLFVELGHKLNVHQPPDPESVGQRLRATASVIADLFGNNIYAELRASDRIQLHRLQEKLLGWLGGADDFDPEPALALWGDLATFVELLGQINSRQELIEHDRSVLRDATRELFSGDAAPEVIPDRLAEMLATLEGRDVEIDRLLRVPVLDPSKWRAPLERLSHVLGSHDVSHEQQQADVDEF